MNATFVVRDRLASPLTSCNTLTRYLAIQERCLVEFLEIDHMKSTLIAAPALALATAQMEFFEKGARDFQVIQTVFSELI